MPLATRACGGVVPTTAPRDFLHGRSIMIPLKDSLLVPYSTNFNDRIVAAPATFSLSSAQAALYTAFHTPYVAAYNAMMAARADGTRSESLTATKNSTKRGLLDYARQLYSFVQSNAS